MIIGIIAGVIFLIILMFSSVFKKIDDKFKLQKEEKIIENLAEKQKKAIKMVMENRISVINGYAGTGKSFTVFYITKRLQNQGWIVSRTAPTGRAAKKISGKTIHSWLVPILQETKNSFKIIGFNKERFEWKECLIIDESSMLNNELFNKVMEIYHNSTFNKNKKIIFVGDSEQLEPVGEGEPFLNIIKNQLFPIITLTKIFRTKNDIVNFANEIRKGTKTINQFQGYKNVKKAKLEDVLNKFLLNYKSFQIISPFNKFKNGTINLNQRIQKILLNNKTLKEKAFESYKWVEKNQKLVLKEDIQFYINDKILFTKNLWGTPIRNGTVAILKNIQQKTRTYLKLNHKINWANDNRVLFLEDLDTKKEIEVPVEIVRTNCTLGYSISVHKAQGSEYKEVCYVLTPDQLKNFISVRMHYTAVTRAKKMVYIIK